MSFKEIPLVDIGAMRGKDFAARRRKAEEVREICHTVGFMYVTNHGVPEELIQRVLRQAEAYFALPLEEKLKTDINKLRYHRGYVPMKALAAQPGGKYDFQEGFEVGFEFPKDYPPFLAGNQVCAPNVWPERPANFQRDVYEYFLAVLGLGRTLFRAFALAFDLPEDWFEDKLENPIANLRLIYYPPHPVEALPDYGAGVGAHSDYECFTILWQSEHGLEVRNPRGEWIAAPPVPGSFVINIGDMMQRWTNDHFVSTPHRVTNRTGRARYSIPLFFSTSYDTIVRPLDRCIAPGDKPHYRPTKVGYWVEQNHAVAYAYRWPDRGRLPDPEIGPVPEVERTSPRAVSAR
jgi:isopenicillin N synthase-like dioxygenase